MGRGRRVSAFGRDLTLGEALSQVTDDLNAALYPNVTFECRRGGVYLVPVGPRVAYLRSYDVRDLLAADDAADRAAAALRLRVALALAFDVRSGASASRDATYFDGRVVVNASAERRAVVRRVLRDLRARASPRQAPPPAAGPTLIEDVRRWDAARSAWVSADQPKALAALRSRVGAFRLSDVPLVEAVALLRARCGANVVIHARSLQEMGFDPLRARVNVDVRGGSGDEDDTTLAEVLTAIEINQPGHGWPERLRWTAQDDVIFVGTGTTFPLWFKPVVRLYDVRDLLTKLDIVVIAARARRPEPSVRGSAYPPPRRHYAGGLEALITESIDPQSWRQDRGSGGLGEVRFFGGRMLVTQSMENQVEIEGLLARLREPRAPETQLPEGK